MIFFSDVDCRLGDGVGGEEYDAGTEMTMEECINEVKTNFPDANGITMDQPCDPIGE